MSLDHVYINNIRDLLIFTKISMGMFQRFVFPSNGKNYFLKVTYTPHSLYVAKISNLHLITNQDHNENSNDFIKKLQTIEGSANVNSVSEPVTNNRLIAKLGGIMKEIQGIMTSMYLSKVNEDEKSKISKNFNLIKSTTMYMKLDNTSKVFLLSVIDLELNLNAKWSSSEKKTFVCKIEQPPSTANLSTNAFKLSNLKISNLLSKDNNNEFLSKTSHIMIMLKNKSNLKNMCLCKGCDHLISKELIYPISYKMLIANHEFKSKLNGSNSVIPDILNKIKTMNLTIESYTKLRTFDSWLENEEKLCNTCYLENTKYIQQFSEFTKEEVIKSPNMKSEGCSRKNLISILDKGKASLSKLQSSKNDEDTEYKLVERMITEKIGKVNYDEDTSEGKFTQIGPLTCTSVFKRQFQESTGNKVAKDTHFGFSDKVKKYYDLPKGLSFAMKGRQRSILSTFSAVSTKSSKERLMNTEIKSNDIRKESNFSNYFAKETSSMPKKKTNYITIDSKTTEFKTISLDNETESGLKQMNVSGKPEIIKIETGGRLINLNKRGTKVLDTLDNPSIRAYKTEEKLGSKLLSKEKDKITGDVMTLEKINDYLFRNTKFYYNPIKTLRSRESQRLDK